MRYLTYLLLWLSVLTCGYAAQAANANYFTATPATTNSSVALPGNGLPGNGHDAPIGEQDRFSQELPSPPPSASSPEPVPTQLTPAESTPSVLAQFPPQETVEQPMAGNFSPKASSNPGAGSGANPGGALDFDVPNKFAATPAGVASAPASAAAAAPPPAATLTAAPALDALFAGNENSIVAKAVGSAEGTRTPDGSRNPAYYGHTDPGNGVWNLGSFSYQHAAASPEDADAKQLARLRKQADQILQKASDKGLSLTLTEKLNGIDLANQAPLAALGQQSYVDWLAVAKSEGKAEADAVLSARVRSFINPKTQRWDAPGLGNTEDRITRDQARRMDAIDRAILANQQQIAQMPPASPGETQLFSQQSDSPFTGVNPAGGKETAAGKTIDEARNTDSILDLNL